MPKDPVEVLSSVLLFDFSILALTIGFFWAGVFVARKLGLSASYGLKALGFARPKPGYTATVEFGLIIAFGTLILGSILNPLSTSILEQLDVSTKSTVQEPLMQGIQEWVGENPATAIPATIFVVAIFAPAVEEIVFRGALYGGLHKLTLIFLRRIRGPGKGAGKTGERLSFVFAALASSMAFAFLHLEPVLLPTLLVLAVALCALYQRTGSLLGTFAAHATFNFYTVVILILGGLGVLPTQV